MSWRFTLAALLLMVSVASAQTTSTAILGTVTDSSGALVPGAQMTLVRVSTGERRTATTATTGDYAFPLLETGEYKLTVEAKGFKSG